MNRLFVFLSVLGLIALFQNCGERVDLESLGPQLVSKIDNIEDHVVRGDREDGQEGGDSSAGSSGLGFLCILDGPDDTVKLALKPAGSAEQNSVPETVCVSEFACLEYVSQVLKVKKAKKSEICSEDPDVILLSDQDVVDLLDL